MSCLTAVRKTAIAFVLLGALGGAARAQTSPEEAKPAPQRTSEAKKAKKKGVLRLDEFTVEGRIQKPTAFFILQRQNLDLDGLEKRETFLPKIVKSVERDPF